MLVGIINSYVYRCYSQRFLNGVVWNVVDDRVCCGLVIYMFNKASSFLLTKYWIIYLQQIKNIGLMLN